MVSLFVDSINRLKQSSQENKLFTPVIKMLRNKTEIGLSSENILKLGVMSHHDEQKNWDLSLSLEQVQKLSNRSKILDAGSGSKAVFANAAQSLGAFKIYACDIQDYPGKNINFTNQDMSATNYKSNFFDLVACHSVIEHGVSIEKFFIEMFRIIKKGGCLIISTDFWPVYEDHSSKYPYGENNAPMKLFNNESIQDLLLIASNTGWIIPTYKKYEPFTPRPVYWERMDSHYTFIWMMLVK